MYIYVSVVSIGSELSVVVYYVNFGIVSGVNSVNVNGIRSIGC